MPNETISNYGLIPHKITGRQERGFTSVELFPLVSIMHTSSIVKVWEKASFYGRDSLSTTVSLKDFIQGSYCYCYITKDVNVFLWEELK